MFVIMKASRMYLGGKGYTGPTCDHADVKPGKVYKRKADAVRDAGKLSKCNPVGFEVVPYRKASSD